jgi:PAS domain S-box-containing protein
MEKKPHDCLNSLTLLYVEDDADSREELAQILRLWFANVYVAENGQAGLERFKSTPVDIVLTDIQMPVLNGLSMSAEIRRQVPDQAVIILSAYNDMEYLFRAIDIGINHYITKPVSVERLLAKLVDMARLIHAKREQRRNQRLLEQYRDVIDAAALVCKLDVAGRITYVNDAFCQHTGYSKDELIGAPMSLLRSTTTTNAFPDADWQSVLGGTPWSGKVTNQRRDGTTYVVGNRLFPIFNEDNQVEEVVCLIVDVA